MNRKLDDLGRLVIPAEMRKQLGISSGDSVNIQLVDNKVIVTSAKKIDNYENLIYELKDFINRCYYTVDGEKVVYTEDIAELIEEFEKSKNDKTYM